MLMKSLRQFASAALASLPLLLAAQYHEPLDVTRIMWDTSTRTCVFDNGNYGRIIPLQDGRLLLAAETYVVYNGISIAESADNGKTWTNKRTIVGHGDKLPVAVPDLIQLSDGTIIVGYNPRPSEYKEGNHFGIRCVRSTDAGETWSDPIYIFDAGERSTEGCWEPSFLELPSGEVHCYFANEYPHQGDDWDQEISVCRSFDKGLTWSEPERVCYRSGSRDGMPSAIITDAGEIVIVVEDNGHPGYHGFRATTMRCQLEQNWQDCWVDADSPNRDMIFDEGDCRNYVSAAPYIRKLPSGETLFSWMGDWYDRKGWAESYYDVYCGVGDKDGRHVGQITQPFKVSSSEHALWNSVNIGFDDRVFVCSSIGGNNAVTIMPGKAVKGFTADFGTPVIDGDSRKDGFTEDGQQLMMGQFFNNRSRHDFLYDNECVYFTSYVADPSLRTEGDVIDGVQLSFDTDNLSQEAPQEGIYTFFIGADGKVEYAVGRDGEFHTAEAQDVKCAVKAGRSYYRFEVAIPWKNLGLDAAPADRTMRVNVAVRDIRADGSYTNEPIPDAQPYASYTWPTFTLTPAEPGSIDLPGADDVASCASALVEWYNLQGARVANPSGGIFIRRQDSQAEKVMMK